MKHLINYIPIDTVEQIYYQMINQKEVSQSKRSHRSNQVSGHSSVHKSSHNEKKSQINDEHRYNANNFQSQKQQYPKCEWAAAYIDGKYYLSDSQTLTKLQQLEKQIEAQKYKLASIQQTQQFDKSFLSHQHPVIDLQVPNYQILTEFNQSRLFERKKYADEILLNEEKQYNNKLEQMKKKRTEIKKQLTNQQNIQANEYSIMLEHEKHINKQKIIKVNQQQSLIHQNPELHQKSQKPKTFKKQSSIKQSHQQSSVRKKESEVNREIVQAQKKSTHSKHRQVSAKEESIQKDNQQQQIGKSIRPSRKSSHKHSKQSKAEKNHSEKKQTHINKDNKSETKSQHKEEENNNNDIAEKKSKHSMKSTQKVEQSVIKSEKKSHLDVDKQQQNKSKQEQQKYNQKQNSQKSEHKSRKSSQKKSIRQIQKNLNLPQPSKNSKVHSLLNDGSVIASESKKQQNGEIKIHVNYVHSEFSDSRSARPQQNDQKQVCQISDHKSQKISPQRSVKAPPSQKQTDKKTAKLSNHSRSKRSEIISHIDNSKVNQLSHHQRSIKKSVNNQKHNDEDKAGKSNDSSSSKKQQSFSHHQPSHQDESKVISDIFYKQEGLGQHENSVKASNKVRSKASQSQNSRSNVSKSQRSHQKASQLDIPHSKKSQSKSFHSKISQSKKIYPSEYKHQQSDISQSKVSESNVSKSKISQQKVSQSNLQQSRSENSQSNSASQSEFQQSRSDISQEQVSHSKISESNVSKSNISQSEVSQSKACQSEISESKVSQSKVSQSEKQSSRIANVQQAYKKSGFLYSVDPTKISPSAFKKNQQKSHLQQRQSDQQSVENHIIKESRITDKSKSHKKSSRSKKHNDDDEDKQTQKYQQSEKPSHRKSSEKKSRDRQVESNPDFVKLQKFNGVNQYNSKRSETRKLSISQSQRLSQKKSRSFVIHSRQKSSHSKKSRNKRDRLQNSERKSQKQQHSSNSNINTNSEAPKNKFEIDQLHNEIKILHQKLKIVQEKQDTMFKFENNQMNQRESSQADSIVEIVSPLRKFNFPTKLKLQKKLSLSGSTVEFNTFEEKKKLTDQENQKLEKLKLQQQIGRLKKTIRDMQMEKIKSIEYEPLFLSGGLGEQRQPLIIDQLQNKSKFSDQRKASIKSDMLEARKNLWASQINVNINDDVGKIVKNNSPEKQFSIKSPRRLLNKSNANRANKFSQGQNQQNQQSANEYEKSPLKKKNIFSAEPNSVHLFRKFEENEKNSQIYFESNQMINEPESQIDIEIPDRFNSKLTQQEIQQRIPYQYSFDSELKSPVMIRNVSERVDKMKQENPEDDNIISKKIQIGNIEFPILPESPRVQMSQNELAELAKHAYAIFKIRFDQLDPNNQLSMKKYKNCVVFSIPSHSTSCILWHYSGKFYIGGWKNNDASEGEKAGQGLEYLPGKHVYKGQFLGGKKNGNGIIKLHNGNIYQGQWVDGVKNGRGVYYEATTNTYYSGQWRDGKRDGYGLLKFSETEFYQGTFQKSIKHGYGKEKFTNGDIYKGQYQRGRFFGKGKYNWANGSSYEGNFIDGMRHGQGSWKSLSTGGDIYIGIYENDKKSGYGRYVWANGCIYEGYFKNDLKNGKGRLQYQDGKQVKGIWENGNIINSDEQIRQVKQVRKMPNHEEEPLKKSIRTSPYRDYSPTRLKGSYL